MTRVSNACPKTDIKSSGALQMALGHSRTTLSLPERQPLHCPEGSGNKQGEAGLGHHPGIVSDYNAGNREWGALSPRSTESLHMSSRVPVHSSSAKTFPTPTHPTFWRALFLCPQTPLHPKVTVDLALLSQGTMGSCKDNGLVPASPGHHCRAGAP